MEVKFLKELIAFSFKVQQRLVMGALISLAVLFGFYQQKVYSSLIRSMVLRKPPRLEPSSEGFCPVTVDVRDLFEPVINAQPDLFWRDDLERAATQAFVLGTFLSAPAGVVADNCGGRWLTGAALTLLSLCTLTLPVLHCSSPHCFLAGTLCQGVAQSALLAGSAVLLAHWAPRSERSSFVGVVFAMKPLGAALGAMNLRAFRDLELAWTTVCYSAGVLGLVCASTVLAVARDTPGRSGNVTKVERRFLWSETDVVNLSGEKTDPKRLVPLKQMFSSKPFLSALLFQFGWSWVRVVLLGRLPTYLTHVLHLTRNLAEATAAFAFLAMGISSVAGGAACDHLVNAGLMSRTASRKLFGLAGNALTPPLLLASVAAGCSGTAVCALIVAACYANGLVDCSFGAVVLDLAPRHAGVTATILNCVHACAELFTWEVFAAVCEHGTGRGEWAVFYLVSAAVALACSLMFFFFGSAEVQPYNGLVGGPDGHLHGDDEITVFSRDDNGAGPTTKM